MSLKQASNKLKDFASELVGNRVLDVYLKYKGIKLLSSATLVPFALLMGRDAFESYVKSRGKQTGGVSLDSKLPVLDDPLLGTYLKIAGLSALKLTPQTLLPLGILLTVHELYLKGQKGGARQSGAGLNDIVKTIVGNRSLDLYLKYIGLKTLSAATLVPFALVMGRDFFEDVVKGNQTGGGILSQKFPGIDDPLLGTYLKFMGLSALKLTPQTLVPVGILVALHELYLKDL